MKYYCNPYGETFSVMYGKEKLGKRLVGFDGKKIYNIFEGGQSTEIHSSNPNVTVNGWLKNKDVIPAPDHLLKQFGLIKNTFYIAKSGKPFSVKVGGEFSKYVWEKKENGDWEPAMIEGADYNAYYDAGTQRARVFDEKVENGLWIKAEVEVKE